MARLGTVPYLNALPLVEGLDEAPGIELVREVPSRLVTRLRSGELDAALVSSVELFRDPPLDWLTVAGVTSEGPVRSILLFCAVEPAAIRSLALDSSSRSAAAMTRVCLTRFLGARPERVGEAAPQLPLDELDADAVLRIGDPALATDPAGREVLDLGAVWTEHTGLPFVYAAWLARPEADLDGVAAALASARDRGLARRDELAARFAAQAGHDVEASVRYLRDAIGFHLGPREQAGLARFGELAAASGLVDHGVLRPPRDA